MEFCCQLGKDLETPGRRLYKTNNFSIMPTLGQIGIEGYLLLCTNEHYDGFGNVPQSLEKEFFEILKKTKDILRREYSKDIVVFEHGPRKGCTGGGTCIDHAHMHVIPLEIDLIRSLREKHLYPIEVQNLGILREIYSENGSYIFIEQEDKMQVARLNRLIPSQFMRKVIAEQIGKLDMWDWRQYPDYATIKKTMRSLEGKFKLSQIS